MVASNLGSIAILVLFFVLFCVYMYMQKLMKEKEKSDAEEGNKEPLLQIVNVMPTTQQEINTISGSVNGQNIDVITVEPSESNRLPYTLAISASKDMRPGYDDPPPTYAQATGMLPRFENITPSLPAPAITTTSQEASVVLTPPVEPPLQRTSAS